MGIAFDHELDLDALEPPFSLLLVLAA
eukprot:COSAG02_NODE_69029_length_205_cov_643.877358_1_plen_26_part_10